MGRIKTAFVKRTGKMLLNLHGEELSDNFEKNKQIVSKYIEINKKLRNSIAGYIVRLKKQELKSK
ncbi:MAG: 30S ribosomal protein S17e [Candidatus Pacearchaeota archaeon]